MSQWVDEGGVDIVTSRWQAFLDFSRPKTLGLTPWENLLSHRLLRGGTVTVTIENMLIKVSYYLWFWPENTDMVSFEYVDLSPLIFPHQVFSQKRLVGFLIPHAVLIFFCFFYWCPQKNVIWKNTILTSMVSISDRPLLRLDRVVPPRPFSPLMNVRYASLWEQLWLTHKNS